MGTEAQIDELHIKITTEIDADVKEIEAIAEALERIKTATEGEWKNLETVVKQINKLDATNQTSFSKFNNSLDTVTSGITNLQRVTKTPIQTNQTALINDYAAINDEIRALEQRYNDLYSALNATAENFYSLTEKQRNMFLSTVDNGVALKKFQKELESVTQKLSEYSQLVKSVPETTAPQELQLLQLDEPIRQANELMNIIWVTGEKIIEIDPSQVEVLGQSAEKANGWFSRLFNNIKSTVRQSAEQTKLATATAKLGNSAEKASFGWDKMWLSIRRIAFYRAVRGLFQLLQKEIANSIKNFVLFDDATNESISGLMSSWKTMSNAFAIGLSQLLNTAAPLLINILDLATSVANAISLIFATISGEETYKRAIKNEENYREALEKTNKQLLGFDRFNVLQGEDTKSLFEEVDVSTGWAEMSIQTELLLAGITALFAPAVITGLATLAGSFFAVGGAISFTTIASKLLLTAGIFAMVFALFELITKWDELSSGMKAFYIILVSVGALITAVGIAMKIKAAYAVALAAANSKAALATLKLNLALGATLLAIGAIAAAIYIFKNWDDFSAGTKRAITIVSTLITVLVAAAVAAMALMGTLTLGIGIPLVLAGIAAAAVAIKGMVSSAKGEFSFFADGGIPDTRGGSAFVMNERGQPELIYENSRGQVQISNQESLEDSFFRALVRWYALTADEQQRIILEIRDKTTGGTFEQIMTPRIIREARRVGLI